MPPVLRPVSPSPTALVVLGRRAARAYAALAVGEDEHRALDAREEFLDDHLSPTPAPNMPGEHLCGATPWPRSRVVDDQDALAGGQTVGLEDVGWL